MPAPQDDALGQPPARGEGAGEPSASTSRSAETSQMTDASAAEGPTEAAAAPWWRRWWPLLAVLGLGIGAILIIALMFGSFYMGGDIPPPEDLAIPEPTIVLDGDGEEIDTLEPGAVHRNVALDELPDHVPQAVLAAEDREFEEHRGFHPRRIARAAWTNLREGEIRQGASTVTQQYVDIAVEETGRTYTGKLREVALAMRLERQVSKDRILEMYLNSVPLGRTAIGVEAGAQVHFGKPADELDMNEAATLAGIIAAPTAFDPERNPEAADQRRRFVLDGMAGEGWITRDEADQLIAEGLPPTREEDLVDFGPEAFYMDAVRRQIDTIVGDEVSDPALDLIITTEMDRDLQNLAHETLNAHLEAVEFEGALVSMDPRDGAIRALIGGTDFATAPYNAAIQGRRQPGSAFKTFGLAAFLAEGYSPESLFPAPAEMEISFAGGWDDYEVSNFGNTGFGQQTVRQATITSTNTVYVQMASEVGPDAVKDQAVAMGIDDHDDFEAVPSLVIGTREVSVLNLTEAYAPLAASGVGHEPRVIRRVESRSTGEVLFDAEPEGEQRIDEDLAHQVTEMLQPVVTQGTGTAANIGRPVAGKTGTTDEHRDAWFAGYVPQLVTTIWVGHLDNTPMPGVTGGSIPARIWGDYMGQAVADMEVEDFPAADWSGLRQLDETPDEPSPTPDPDPTPEEPDPTPEEPDPTPDETAPPEDDEEEEDEETENGEEENGEGDDDLTDEVLGDDDEDNGDDDQDGDGENGEEEDEEEEEEDGNGDGNGNDNGDGEGNGENDGEDD